jgi:hypothetical protein
MDPVEQELFDSFDVRSDVSYVELPPVLADLEKPLTVSSNIYTIIQFTPPTYVF